MASAGGGGPRDPAAPDARSATARRRHRWRSGAGLAIACAAAFLALSVVVLVGAADRLDLRIAHHFRPDDAWWGDLQKAYSPWMSRLRPAHVALLFAATVLATSARRRSWWPLLFAAALSVAAVGSLVLVQVLLARPDPHGFVEPRGGSYPSGHMLAVVVFLSGCLLVTRRRVLWWWALVVVPSALMATSLVVTVAHWPTDVLGGAVLGAAVVATSSRSRFRGRLHDRGGASGQPRS